jgi:hypothetical protein
MRRAAHEAGLIPEESSDRLELALEPEAACIACEAENPALENGDTFMVLDCGGGTVDITMHRVAQKTPDLLLDELRSPSGGPWGSTFIDAEFEKFVEKLIGTEAFRRFKPSSPWVEVMRAWETVKLGYDPSVLMAGDSTKAINMSGVLEVSRQVKYIASHKLKIKQLNRRFTPWAGRGRVITAESCCRVQYQVLGICRFCLDS